MISLLSAFLPVHPFGFKWNNNRMCVAQLCENNGQGEWNFLILKISQRKGKRESNECRYDTKDHPAWHSCVIFRWSLEQPDNFNGTNAQRGYPDEWMNVKTGNFHKTEEETLYTAVWGFYLTSLFLTSNCVTSLFFRTICWLGGWNIT